MTGITDMMEMTYLYELSVFEEKVMLSFSDMLPNSNTMKYYYRCTNSLNITMYLTE